MNSHAQISNSLFRKDEGSVFLCFFIYIYKIDFGHFLSNIFSTHNFIKIIYEKLF